MKKCKLEALGDRVIVQVIALDEVTEMGIILPSNMKLAQKEAVVVSVGVGKLLPDGKRSEMLVKVGDRVIIDQGFGAEIKYDDETYLIFEHDNILAKI